MLTDATLVGIYRDIFAEITAKATPIEFSETDPEHILAYRVPCGPIHRAAGRLGFQMFEGERHLSEALTRIRQLEHDVGVSKDANKRLHDELCELRGDPEPAPDEEEIPF